MIVGNAGYYLHLKSCKYDLKNRLQYLSCLSVVLLLLGVTS